MNKKIFSFLGLALFPCFLFGQQIEISINTSPFSLAKNQRTTTTYNNQIFGKSASDFHSNYYIFAPEISFINSKNSQVNFKLSFKNSSYHWNTYYSPTNYTLSKGQKYYGGFEIGNAKRITLNRLLFLPELFAGYSALLYQRYNGSNVGRDNTDEILVTYYVDEPTQHTLSFGFQNGMYYKLNSKMHLGINIRLAGKFTIVDGKETYIREDVYDNLYGDENKVTRITTTTLSQSSEMGISFRYRIK